MDVFDQIISGATPAEVILRTDKFIAFLDVRPVFPGHTLVCPIDHHETLYDLPAELYAEMLVAARRIGLAQQAALGADGTLLVNNNVVSQSVPHYHLHVIPRRRKDGLRGFLWPRTRPTVDELRTVGDQLRAALTDEEPDE
ncbi:MAG: HIT family protein [Brooklawnia sp.]|uniref:HIT family protein n=1 Tax=Brooklawnia sp. TaxID=2699740 RepID=UPI003C75A3BA